MRKTEFFTASDGARLAYLDEGPRAGKPLLCLSGLTRVKEDFDPALPALQGCRILRMDYRGRGESDYTGAPTYTVAREAQDALELLDHLGVAEAALLGTSRGGLIGLFLAATAKHRLTGLCLVDIGPELDPEGLRQIASRIGKRPRVKTLAEMADLLETGSTGFAHVPKADWRGMAARLYRETEAGLEHRYDSALVASFKTAMDAPTVDAWPLWSATEGLPVALIRGANSDLLSVATAQRMRELRPDLLFAEVPDRGHVPFLNEREATATLKDWIDSLP